MADKPQRLNDLKQKILDDNVGAGLKTTATQLVFGDGNPNADLVFIGEAPGKNEDIHGIPFVGAAGKFLNEMLGMIDLKREDIYITNIVKYRPPENRDPSPEEKAEFLPYLQAQLDIIEPVLVVTLGRHSLNCFLPDLQISKVHGEPKRMHFTVGHPGSGAMQGGAEQQTKPSNRDGEGAAQAATQQRTGSWVILPLFHPAAALYNGGMRQTLIDDFARIPTIMKKINDSKQ